MEKDSFSLSFSNMKGIPFDKYEKNFTFVVNNQQYETNRYVADILSPIVREYHYIDETIDSITIKNTEEEKEDMKTNLKEVDYFSDFLKLVDFTSQNIDEEHKKHYIEYFIKLGNINEYLRLQFEYFGEISSENVLDRLKLIFENIESIEKVTKSYQKETNGIFDFLNIKQMISYASSHFSEIDKEKFKKLPKNLIEEIVKSDELKLEEEDELLNIIIELYEEKEEYSDLFEYIKFENVSEESLSKFISTFNIEFINIGIWRSICHRLLPQKEKAKDERYLNLIKTIEIKAVKGHEFEGIIGYLTEKSGGNIEKNGTIEITSNSNSAKNIIDYKNDTLYYSNSESNAYVCFDFKERRIQLSSYSIKSQKSGSGNLRNWAIEVSNDNKSWEEVDRHSNDAILNGSNIVAIFNIKKEQTDFYRYIRFHQTGVSWHNSYCLYLQAIEFFGKIEEKQSKIKH